MRWWQWLWQWCWRWWRWLVACPVLSPVQAGVGGAVWDWLEEALVCEWRAALGETMPPAYSARWSRGTKNVKWITLRTQTGPRLHSYSTPQFSKIVPAFHLTAAAAAGVSWHGSVYSSQKSLKPRRLFPPSAHCLEDRGRDIFFIWTVDGGSGPRKNPTMRVVHTVQVWKILDSTNFAKFVICIRTFIESRCVAYIYVAWQASQLSSVAGWAKLGLSPSSDLRHTNAEPKPLGRHQQTCLIQSAPERWLPFIFIPKPPGIQVCARSFLPDANLISRAVRIRAISVEVKCTVLSSAMGMFIFTKRWYEWKQRGQAHEPETTQQQLKEKRLRHDCVYESRI